MGPTIKSIITGGMGGLVATSVMTLVLVAAEQAGFVGRFPPKRMTEGMLDAVERPPRSKLALDVATLVSHVGYGTSFGSLFGLLYQRLRLAVNPGLQGVIFGSLLWALGYAGWGPLLGIIPPPHRAQPGRPLTLVPAHGVYGWTLGTLVARWLGAPPATAQRRRRTARG